MARPETCAWSPRWVPGASPQIQPRPRVSPTSTWISKAQATVVVGHDRYRFAGDAFPGYAGAIREAHRPVAEALRGAGSGDRELLRRSCCRCGWRSGSSCRRSLPRRAGSARAREQPSARSRSAPATPASAATPRRPATTSTRAPPTPAAATRPAPTPRRRLAPTSARAPASPATAATPRPAVATSTPAARTPAATSTHASPAPAAPTRAV